MFKVGDSVKYTSGNWTDEDCNPLWNGKYGQVKGRIIDMAYNTIYVKWSNGCNNCYDTKDLQKLTEHKDLFGNLI
jgi:hypothetical protein